MTYAQSPRSLPSPGPPSNLDEVLVGACRAAGVRVGRVRLLRHFANAVYLVADVPVVVRLAYGPADVERSARAVAVTAWLAEYGFPVTEPAPLPSGAAQPIVIACGDREVAATFWRYYPQPDPPPRHGLDTLASVARALHAISALPPVPLPGYQPLRSVSGAVEAARRCGLGDAASLAWLAGRIAELREEYQGLTFPLGSGLIHADLHAGNLLRSRVPVVLGGVSVVLGDWDSVCRGPRVIDLVPAYATVRFGGGAADVDRFAAGYGYDLRDWSGFPTLRAIRDVSTLTALVRLAPTDPGAARELRHRMDSLRRGDTTVTWTPQ